MKIIDCFMYFDEDMMLDIRLNVLNKFVSHFVICEAAFNHKGLSKKLDNNPALLSIEISYPSFLILLTVEGVSATLFSFDLFSFSTPIFIIIKYYSNVK